MSTNFDFDTIQSAIDAAPSAGFGPRSTFGKWTYSDLVIASWQGEKGSRKLVTRPVKTGDTLKQGEYFQITFNCDMSEMNPALTKLWSRRVDIKKSDKTSKDQSKWTLTDWSEIVEPSLKAIFGKDWLKLFAKGLYAEALEATTIETNKLGELKGWDAKEPDADGNIKHYTNTVPQFVTKFKSKADCLAAYQEKYKKADDDFAFGDDEVSIPDKVISDVKGMLSAVSNEQALELLPSLFPSYDLVALLTAAGAPDELLAQANELVSE